MLSIRTLRFAIFFGLRSPLLDTSQVLLDTEGMFYRSRPAVVLLVAVLALALRLPGIGTFMTVDEENWMIRSGQFWHQLVRNQHPQGTFLTTHPGATTMWLAGAGIFWQEHRLGFDVDTSNLRHFRLAAVLPLAAATSLLIGIAVIWLVLLVGRWPAVAAGVLLASEPYLVGMSQAVHLDALLALFMLDATLAFLLYHQRRQITTLVVSGIFSGLALATKLLPALWLFIFFGMVLFVIHRRQFPTMWRDIPRVLFLVMGVAALTFYAAWPALWIKDDIARSLARDIPAVVTQEHVAVQESEEPIHPASSYLRTLLGRTTPLVLILSTGMLIASTRSMMKQKKIPLSLWLMLYAVGFLVLITLAAKKADRYALPALIVFPVIAGWALSVAGKLQTRNYISQKNWIGRISITAISIVLIMVVVHTLLLSPYAIAYNNPFADVRHPTQQGWGEGLDEAARWLNAKPFVDRLTVASWYPGVTRTYFTGKTMSLSSRHDHRVGYLVTYRNMYGRAPDDIATNVLEEFRDQEPAYVVSIQGRPYVWVYDTIGPFYFPQHVGELAAGMEVGQTVPVAIDNWSRIDIAFATFGRQNTGAVTLHIRGDVNASNDIRTAVISAADVPDQDWQSFEFEPIADSAGRTYYIALTSDAPSGGAVTVRFSPEDIKLGQALIRRRTLGQGEQNNAFLREGDIGYRLE